MKMGAQGVEAGFDMKRVAGDVVVARLLAKYDLPSDASLANIEAVAKVLLCDPRTALDAAQLVLNRRVDAKEKLICELILTPGFSGAERFGLLLLEQGAEEGIERAGKTDFGTTKSLFVQE